MDWWWISTVTRTGSLEQPPRTQNLGQSIKGDAIRCSVINGPSSQWKSHLAKPDSVTKIKLNVKLYYEVWIIWISHLVWGLWVWKIIQIKIDESEVCASMKQFCTSSASLIWNVKNSLYLLAICFLQNNQHQIFCLEVCMLRIYHWRNIWTTSYNHSI